MKQKAHYNPKSKRQILSLIIMIVVCVAVVFGSAAIKSAVDKANNGQVAVDLAPAKSIPSAVKENELGITGVEKLCDEKGNVVAYLIKGTTVGYNADVPIEMETTVSADGKYVYGIDIIKQEETEYLGVRIATDDFKNQFNGKKLPVSNSNSIEKGSKVDVIAKSTVSSQAVIDGVNNASQYANTYLVE